MEEISRLRWHCRRGSLELDLMLSRYLERVFPAAQPAEKEAFRHLLELQDPALLGYLMGRETPQDPRLAGLVEKIRACAGTQA